ncbi:MAG TPA: DEAD/DEAH box helicase [Acidimicrobiales bacterium]
MRELAAALDAQGITDPSPIQAATLPDAIAGRDLCGKAKTGSGKTLAFALPIVQRLSGKAERSPRALVLVPTRELAAQVLDVLKPLAQVAGLRVMSAYGGTPLDRQLASLEKGADVVVATPGRLIDLLERGAVRLDDIEICVLDEADRMADMGFLPQVEWVLRKLPAGRQKLLFSATLDSQVDGLVRHYLRDPSIHTVGEDGGKVAEMRHAFLAVHEMDRVKVVAAITRGVERTMVFVRTKRGADRLAARLVREGVRAEPMHGDLRQSAREKALRAFSKGEVVLVATDVAARGIHVDDVDVVVQFDPPEDHKAYLHRAGRTARAGRAGVVVTLVLWNQELEVERLKTRLNLTDKTVEVFSNNPVLADLRTFTETEAQAS